MVLKILLVIVAATIIKHDEIIIKYYMHECLRGKKTFLLSSLIICRSDTTVSYIEKAYVFIVEVLNHCLKVQEQDSR